MTTRPKQRVLVRWNDDLDKSLLLFITHTCTDMGIKIPYDEVARRMGSTFTEGAIQQHISKLRNKMADLNVAPVPAPPKRGAVTSKPSSIYAQKTRAGPQPPQPVASKTQSKTSAKPGEIGTNRTSPTTKRSTRRKATTMKRSDSDGGHTGDEFDGASDDDFTGATNNHGKRGRATARRGSDHTAKKATNKPPVEGIVETHAVMQELADADAKFEAQYGHKQDFQPGTPHDQGPVWLQPSIEGRTEAWNVRTPFPMAADQPFDYGEEEEEEESFMSPIATTPAGAPTTGQPVILTSISKPFAGGQDQQVSPTSILQMPPQPEPFFGYNGPPGMLNNFGGNYPQTISQAVPAQQNTLGSNHSNTFDFGGNFSMANGAPPFQQSYAIPQMPPPAFPGPATSMATLPHSTRNHSLVSNSSQNAFSIPPRTPGANSPSAMNVHDPSPANSWANVKFDSQNPTPNPMSEWDSSNAHDSNDGFQNALFGDDSISSSFVNGFFG